MNFLFINNDSFYSGLITEFLCFNGYTVYEAAHPQLAQDVLKHKRVDAVLCYVPLEPSETLALLAAVRSHDASLPIITLMTDPHSAQAQQIRALTPYCLIMPCAVEQLLRAIADATGITKRKMSLQASTGSWSLSTVQEAI